MHYQTSKKLWNWEVKQYQNEMFKFLEATATMVSLKFALIFQYKYVDIDDQNMVCYIQYIHINLFWKLYEKKPMIINGILDLQYQPCML